MNFRITLITIPLLVLIVFSGCENKVNTPLTNPDAIVNYLNANKTAQILNDPDFISSDTVTLYSALNGDFHTKQFALHLDSAIKSYEVSLGDTVTVNNILAREAEAEIHYKLHYTLWMKDTDGVETEKHLVTDPDDAYKNNYFLQLGSTANSYRGWLLWGTTYRFDQVRPIPNLTWSSEELGDLPATDDVVSFADFVELNSRDIITVTYTGQPDDIVYLTINETGTPNRTEMTTINGSTTIRRADWRISSNPVDQEYFYAGIEIYRLETLSTTDSTYTEFKISGLMYSIADN